MSDNSVRIGKVSAIDYETGMIEVLYTDMGKAVTKKMPYMNFNDEYSMPKVGTQVLTAHLSNGNSRGIVLGPVWNKKNKPEESGKGIYRKEFSKTRGAAFTRYDDSAGVYWLQSGGVTIIAINEAKLESPEVEVSASASMKIKSPKIVVSADKHKLCTPSTILGGTDEEGNSIEEMEVANKCDITFSSEEKKIRAMVKSMVVETVEELSITAGTNLNMEDSNWKTTLDKIMTRLTRLDGDMSDRK